MPALEDRDVIVDRYGDEEERSPREVENRDEEHSDAGVDEHLGDVVDDDIRLEELQDSKEEADERGEHNRRHDERVAGHGEEHLEGDEHPEREADGHPHSQEVPRLPEHALPEVDDEQQQHGAGEDSPQDVEHGLDA